MNSRPFDLVLLDIMMPKLNGYEVLDRMKADDRLRHIPVIMISAVDELDSVIRCIELGAEDYLPKPFNPTLLRARVGAALERKRLFDEVNAHLERLEAGLDAARKLQVGMVPHVFPTSTAAVRSSSIAMVEPAHDVGGDLFDFFHLRDIGFASSSAMSRAREPPRRCSWRARGLVRMAVELWWEQAEMRWVWIIEAVNHELCQNNRDRMFVTLFLGVLQDRRDHLRQCGSPRPLRAARFRHHPIRQRQTGNAAGRSRRRRIGSEPSLCCPTIAFSSSATA